MKSCKGKSKKTSPSDAPVDASTPIAETSTTKGKTQNFQCDVCNISVYSKYNFDEHVKGRKHLKNVNNAQELSSESTTARKNCSESNEVCVLNQDGNAMAANTNASKRKARKPYNHHLHQNNGYYPGSYHQQYPNYYHQPYPNFRQKRGNSANWYQQPPLWQESPGEFRDAVYPPYDQSDGYCPGYRDGGEMNKNVASTGVSDHAPDDAVPAENNEVQLVESNSSADPNLNGHLSRSEVQTSNTASSNTQNSPPKKLSKKKEASLPVGSGQESSKCPKAGDEKQTEKRSILTENVIDKIAHWINPSNPKDKAEVKRMVTEFSKSKKKENLLRLKIQAGSISNENCSRKQDSPSSDALVKDAAGKPSNDLSNGAVMKRPRSNSETLQQAGNINPFISESSTSQRGRRLQRFKSTTESPPRKARRKSLSNSVEVGRLSENAQVLKEVAAEKRRKEQKCANPKKHKCSTAECLESCINEVVKGTADQVNMNGTSDFPIPPVASMDLSTLRPPNPVISNPEDVQSSTEEIQRVPVKREIMDEGVNMQIHPCILEVFSLEDHMNKTASDNANQSEEATITPVESLIDIFTSGNIKIKKEFDDPMIDVIRTVDPEILNRVCEGQSAPMIQEAPAENNANSTADTEDASNNISFFKSSIKNILNEIQSISVLEDELKKNQEQAESKIHEYQILVEEWKMKKVKFHGEEETLRKQRNNLVRTMADLVTQCNVEQNIAADIQNDSTSNRLAQIADSNVSSPSNALSSERFPPTVQNKPNVPSSNSNGLPEVEDIAILPVPEKSNNIPVIDLEDFCASEATSTPVGTERGLQRTEDTCDMDSLLEIFSKQRNYAVHDAVINCIQLFEGYIYTGANDSTAKRFSLKDCSDPVIYQHQKKNVIQLCVQKVRGLTLVFTICSGSKILTSFKAEDGVLFRTFNLNYIVASICRGRNLIYAGLRNGSIILCNWKDHKEVVNISESIRSIDTTQQGSLNIIVTLSTSGNVSIRDADRSGLLIRYVKARSYIPLFMTVCSDSIYLSSAGVLTVLNIESGTFVTKYSFSAAYTSLAVYRDSIFTASFSGMVRCYSKDEEKAVKMYYGAGGNAITCIHVYHGWVFTANRSGILSVFKYDPNSEYSCKLGKCDFIFPLPQDLELHVLQRKDHDMPSAGTTCSWRKCQLIIPGNWDAEAIKSHLKSHL